MTIRLLILVFLICTLTACGPTAVENAPPGVKSGKITLYNISDSENAGQWFDFSEARVIIEADEHKQGDFCLFRTFLRSIWPVTCGIQDSQSDSLWRHTANPTYGYETPDSVKSNADVAIYTGHVYYMTTGEGHYARIKVVATEMNDDATSFNSITFYWGYQPNGTEFFGVNPDGSPVLREGEEEGQTDG
jgi:hypothetical protein